MVTLPLCRIRDRLANGALVLDENFIPTCQSVRVSNTLVGLPERFRGWSPAGQLNWQVVLVRRNKAALPMWPSL